MCFILDQFDQNTTRHVFESADILRFVEISSYPAVIFQFNLFEVEVKQILLTAACEYKFTSV